MATLTNTEDLSLPLTRQELFNMWATATVGTIAKTDLAPGVFTMDVGSDLTSATNTPEPGHTFYSHVDQLMFVFHDEIDNTGVSLWLAVGPDRFDVACLANSPIAAGAVVQPDYDKWVGVSTGASGSPAFQTAIGTNAQGINLNDPAIISTAASGTWIPVSIDGIVWGLIEGTLNVNRWIRVDDSLPGHVVRSSNAFPAPDSDDVIGFGYIARSASSDTPVNTNFIWTGPRVINAL